MRVDHPSGPCVLVMAVCVAIHVSGLAWAIGWLRRRPARLPRFAPHLRPFIVMAVWIVLLHLAEISDWGMF